MRTFVPLFCILLMAGAYGAYRYERASIITAEAATTSPEATSGAVAPIGVLQSGPSLTAAQIDNILTSYGSPAVGSGQDFYNLGVQYGIDPAYALAFFVEESSAGTDPRWDGNKPDGSTTHDIGNIACTDGYSCYGRWRDYATWHDGIEDWYKLITVEYIQQRGHSTVDDVIPVYAPAFENDTAGYTNTVNALVAQWRAKYQFAESSNMIASNPISLAGDCGYNVQVALNANNGALQHVTLQPGETFSFNASMGNPAAISYVNCAGVPGGNWCNLAARYAQVARAIGLVPRFKDHGVGDMGAGAENSVLIWNVNGQPGSTGESADLEITNTTGHVVTFRAEQQGDSVVIVAS